MAFDGTFLSRIKNEINDNMLGAKIDKITQPSREEIILHLRRSGGGGKLLLSAGAGSPRIHFTSASPDNPKAPPMFCMLLRKHLSGAKLTGARQMGLDRILMLDFDTSNELGDMTSISIAIEIMGRHSNIIVIGPDGKIIDSVKRVDMETSSVRQVLPGMRYKLPPAQDKLNPVETPVSDILERLNARRNIELSKALMESVQGLSPIICREVAFYTTRGIETIVSDLTTQQRERLIYSLNSLKETLLHGKCTPTLVAEPNGRPRDFAFIPIQQYGASMLTRDYASCGEMLDAFYSDRDRIERIKQRSGDLLKLLVNTSDRIRRKLAAQREELKECAGREQLRIKGDLINANLYSLQKGDRIAKLSNFYSPNCDELEIELDPTLTPPQNAQRYYTLYRKAASAEKMLASLIEQGEQELLYIDSVFDSLTRASGINELESIRDELIQGKYIRRMSKGKQPKPEKLPPLRYRSSDGFLILAGRNNLQNDRLTLKDSNGNDIWLHTQKIHGAHVVIVTQGTQVPDKTLEEACIVAAFQSQARESSKVPVDFTQVRYVKKPVGSKPGMVIYDKYQTVIVDPDEELVKSLSEKYSNRT